ncbi:hypothetical protein HK104_011221 [Borealophlyctis nickersoniae]|nr:hypothetical protein HK104_011221 [Borealophlyctis nickersoniae]
MALLPTDLLNILAIGALMWGGIHTFVYCLFQSWDSRGVPASWVWMVKALGCFAFVVVGGTMAGVYYQYLGWACYAVGKANTVTFHLAMLCVAVVLCTRLAAMIGWNKWWCKALMAFLILQRLVAAGLDTALTYNSDNPDLKICDYHGNDATATFSLCSDIIIDLTVTIGFIIVCARYLIQAGSVSDLYSVLIESNVLRSSAILASNVVQLVLMYTIGTASPWMTTVWALSDLCYMYVVSYDSDMLRLLRHGASGSSSSRPYKSNSIKSSDLKSAEYGMASGMSNRTYGGGRSRAGSNSTAQTGSGAIGGFPQGSSVQLVETRPQIQTFSVKPADLYPGVRQQQQLRDGDARSDVFNRSEYGGSQVGGSERYQSGW